MTEFKPEKKRKKKKNVVPKDTQNLGSPFHDATQGHGDTATMDSKHRIIRNPPAQQAFCVITGFLFQPSSLRSLSPPVTPTATTTEKPQINRFVWPVAAAVLEALGVLFNWMCVCG